MLINVLVLVLILPIRRIALGLVSCVLDVLLVPVWLYVLPARVWSICICRLVMHYVLVAHIPALSQLLLAPEPSV